MPENDSPVLHLRDEGARSKAVCLWVRPLAVGTFSAVEVMCLLSPAG